jgi:hypothetical protein
MQDLSTGPASREMPKKIVRISPNIIIEMGCRENETDGSVYPAVSFCKYKRNSYSHAKNAFVGRAIEISFGLRTAKIAADAINAYLNSVSNKYN